ncbi:IS3 family transposase [Pseudonocardia sp. Ae717_Ps2]|uniref:IS3 family transposase n=1 Tax=Pseudonocardia sp. Ae717_Ps2 TaxID=1885573 RepID=UPI0009F9A931
MAAERLQSSTEAAPAARRITADAGQPSTGRPGATAPERPDLVKRQVGKASLKIELLYWPGTTFATRRAAEHALIRYLDGWYNLRRIQARLGGLSPGEYEDNYRRAQRDADG